MRVFQPRCVQIAFEGMKAGGFERFPDWEIQRFGAHVLAIGARRIEMRVAGNDVAGLAQCGEENPLSGVPLVRGNHILEAGDCLHRVTKTAKAGRARVGLVAVHHRRPLIRAYGARP